MKNFMQKLIVLPLMINFIISSNVQAGVKPEKMNVIRDVLAELSYKLESGESQKKTFLETTMLLKEKDISPNELVHFVASDMKPSEAKAFKAKMEEKLDEVDVNTSSEEMSEMFSEILATTSKGANFLPLCNLGNIPWIIPAAMTLVFSIKYANTEDKRYAHDQNRKNPINSKREMETTIDLFRASGFSESSQELIRAQADLKYLNETISEENQGYEKTNRKMMLMGGLALASGALLVGTFSCN